MIKKNNISVIVQGPFYKSITPKVLLKISNIFKESELIFSTYKGDKINKNIKSKYKIIYNQSTPRTPNSLNPLMYYNYTGHIRTSLNGIKNSSKKYVLKTRSDVLFKNSNFLKYYDKFKYVDNKNNILKKKVIISSHYTIDPRKNPLPLHFSDWFFFGLKSDLKKIFNQKYMSPDNKKIALWFLKRKKPKFFFNHYMSKYRAEQNLVINFLKKYTNINLNHGYEHNVKNTLFTEKILANNFVVLNPKLISFDCLRHPNFSDNQDLLYFNELITYNRWQKIYQKYCNNELKISSPSAKEVANTIKWVILNPKEAIYKFYLFNKYKLD